MRTTLRLTSFDRALVACSVQERNRSRSRLSRLVIAGIVGPAVAVRASSRKHGMVLAYAQFLAPARKAHLSSSELSASRVVGDEIETDNVCARHLIQIAIAPRWGLCRRRLPYAAPAIWYRSRAKRSSSRQPPSSSQTK